MSITRKVRKSVRRRQLADKNVVDSNDDLKWAFRFF
jgi:hypothetical protein